MIAMMATTTSSSIKVKARRSGSIEEPSIVPGPRTRAFERSATIGPFTHSGMGIGA